MPALDVKLDDLLVTPKALSRLADIRRKAVSEGRAGADSLHLRLRVDGGGCSGFKYEFAIETEAAGEDDIIFPPSPTPFTSPSSLGGRVVVDSVSLGMVKGSTVDWDDGSLLRAAFVVANNPNAESSCGCKSSFAVKSG
jgi:iron-sulfur cluster assembly accessory protein